MEGPSIMSHVSVGTNNFEKAKVFYESLLTTIGARVTEDMSAYKWVSFGKEYTEFWVGEPADGKPATVGNGTHISFNAPKKEQVDAFHAKALGLGAKDCGAPGPRADYGAGYYGAFVTDLDGHKIEVCYWDESAT